MDSNDKMLGKYNNIISIVVAVLTTLGGGWLWFESKVDTFLDEQIRPYQGILIGLSMQQAGNHDEAIENFYSALVSLERDKVNRESLIAVVDPLLISIAAVNQPHKYEVQFKKALNIIEGEVRSTGDRHNSIAWIYWSVGDNSNARKHFNRSINSYIQDGVKRVAGNSYYGAFLTHIVDGTFKENFDLYNYSWEYDYERYNPGQIVNNVMYKEDWMVPLLSIYGDFQANYDAFIAHLNQEYKIEPRTYR